MLPCLAVAWDAKPESDAEGIQSAADMNGGDTKPTNTQDTAGQITCLHKTSHPGASCGKESAGEDDSRDSIEPVVLRRVSST